MAGPAFGRVSIRKSERDRNVLHRQDQPLYTHFWVIDWLKEPNFKAFSCGWAQFCVQEMLTLQKNETCNGCVVSSNVCVLSYYTILYLP